MAQLRLLIAIASLANILTAALYLYATSQPGGSGLALAFIVLWMPEVWLTTIIVTMIIVAINRKALFQKRAIRWTLLTLLFTTPIPAIAFYYLTHPTREIGRYGTMTNTINGKVYVTEFWKKTSTHKNFAIKRFIA